MRSASEEHMVTVSLFDSCQYESGEAAVYGPSVGRDHTLKASWLLYLKMHPWACEVRINGARGRWVDGGRRSSWACEASIIGARGG